MKSATRILFSVCLWSALSGCVQEGTWDKINEYGGSKSYANAKSVTVDSTSYVIQEHEKKDRILIRWSNGDNIGNAIASNATLGIVNNTPDSELNKIAAAQFIYENQAVYENCKVREAYLVQTPWYEVFFDC